MEKKMGRGRRSRRPGIGILYLSLSLSLSHTHTHLDTGAKVLFVLGVLIELYFIKRCLCLHACVCGCG